MYVLEPCLNKINVLAYTVCYMYIYMWLNVFCILSVFYNFSTGKSKTSYTLHISTQDCGCALKKYIHCTHM